MIHSIRATAALQALSEADPAVAALALWCRHRDTAGGAPPAWTDGATVYYAPEFETLPRHDQAGLAAHQILHIAFRHAPRGQALRERLGDAFDEHLYALGCDAILNQMLTLAGHTLPRPYVLLTELLEASFGDSIDAPTALSGTDAEALYMRLSHPPRPGGAKPTQDKPGQAKTQQAEPANAARAYAARRHFDSDLDLSIADPDHADSPEAADWRQHLTRALEAGRAAGRGLGLLTPFLADQPSPRTQWEQILRHLVTRAVTRAPRQSHARPARRWLALDAAARAENTDPPAFLPGIAHDTRVPRIALCLDASSSIPDPLLARFQAQIAAIGKRTGAELHLLIFDEDVRDQYIADPARNTIREMPRGGGTDYAPVLTKAAALVPSYHQIDPPPTSTRPCRPTPTAPPVL